MDVGYAIRQVTGPAAKDIWQGSNLGGASLGFVADIISCQAGKGNAGVLLTTPTFDTMAALDERLDYWLNRFNKSPLILS
jgi:hypothetical protein